MWVAASQAAEKVHSRGSEQCFPRVDTDALFRLQVICTNPGNSPPSFRTGAYCTNYTSARAAVKFPAPAAKRMHLTAISQSYLIEQKY